MKPYTIFLLLILSTIYLCGCSGDNEADEPGKIDQMTKQAGQEAVKWIKTPLDKANNVSEMSDERAREFNERREQSE